jgi:hypothetical protein
VEDGVASPGGGLEGRGISHVTADELDGARELGVVRIADVVDRDRDALAVEAPAELDADESGAPGDDALSQWSCS